MAVAVQKALPKGKGKQNSRLLFDDKKKCKRNTSVQRLCVFFTRLRSEYQVRLYSAALFGRSSTLAIDTHRVGVLRVRCHDVLDPNVVLPVVVEVILVQKPLAEAEAKIPQLDPFWIIGKANASLIGDAVLSPVDEKPMEMAVRPSHGQLKDMMKICDGGLSGDEEPTPDQGTDAPQGTLELVHNRS